MRELKHQLTIAATLSVTFDWFKNLDENYIRWHPEAHQKFEWLSGKPIRRGSIFSFEENIRGHHHKMLMQVTEYEENMRLSFSSIKIQTISVSPPLKLISFLGSLFRIKMEMTRIFESTSENTTTIYTTHKLGSKIPFIGKIVDWIIEHIIFTSKYHLEHIAEEGHYMKLNLETKNIA
jgi:hypothetical protein